ncbi:holo-ACP synthase [soil metagenome]
MIIGIGTDIVKVARMEENINRFGVSFSERILSPAELNDLSQHKNPANFLAKRFAAKEALFKALGTGFRGGIALKEVGVDHEASGKPIFIFSDKATVIVQARGVQHMHISIADESEYAIAMVVLES